MQAVAADRFYNVGTGKRTSLRELAQMLIELTGSTKPINYAPRSTATLVRNRIGSPVRATEEIGFTAEIELREGLERIIAWRASHKSEVDARRNSAGFQA
jgi:UDP-glucose 4-epimerase